MPRRNDSPRAGQIIGGRFRVDGVLGTGGVGTVFDATALEDGTRVALKTLLPTALDDEDTVLRFQREAQAAAAVARDGVVAVLEFGDDAEVGPYLVMERLEGEPLSARLARAAPTVAEAVSWMTQVLETLSAVHARSIVHRDLKPGNLFLVPGRPLERVKILDFGLSHVPATGGRAKLTLPGEVLGTPRYMSPEQALGDPIDARSDLYSVGILLYACLLGQPPYHEVPVTKVLKAVLDGPPRSLRELRPGLPEKLYGVVDRALERDRARRFPSAAEFRAALVGAMAPAARTEAPPPAPQPPSSASSRWPIVVALVAVAVLAVIACASGVAGMVAYRLLGESSSRSVDR